MAALQTLVCVIAGVIFRLWLYRSFLPEWLSTRAEIVTPTTSWERAMEGLSLKQSFISPYSGDLFHETPLMLRILGFMNKFSQNSINLMFVGLDLVCAILLLKISKMFGGYLLVHQARSVKNYATDIDSLILRSEDLHSVQFLVTIAHAFNPYCIAACLARSTAIFNNLALLFTIYYLLKGNKIMCGCFLAIASYLTMYPIILLAPVAIFFYQRSYPTCVSYTDPRALSSYVQTSVITLVWLAAFIGASAFLEESWDFLNSTYGFTLTVPDLTPNLGVFWYFFTEMFEHFRTFFICVFQINVVIYTFPLSIKLREHPVFLLYLLIFLIGIFKSYPSFADVGLFLCLLPLWKHVFSYMRNTFVVTCMFVCTTVFAPILHHLWLYAGSANANFYFAIALAFSTAEIFLVTDLLFAFLRREFDMHHGKKHIMPDGAEGQK
ncbi:Phosphatidylinositol glycan anchor biosynthesis class U protein [Mizuhopecten yessoensis]|uniref:Phosphatidylinositol glycan anchor biosynthesis class U protein n=1 Tax=Mizuhopecten yessoensis TaxID=6573 RepID=A0A210R276_MIZYE|nr:Phosphatidylinositol glycan anchor biosynthesis class U protein [Mizuhopecten yessoensis]